MFSNLSLLSECVDEVQTVIKIQQNDLLPNSQPTCGNYESAFTVPKPLCRCKKKIVDM